MVIRCLTSTRGTADTEYSSNIFVQFRFSLDMVKDDWTQAQVLQARNCHLIFVQFIFSFDMVKDDWIPLSDTADHNTHLNYFLHFRFSLHMVKDDWTPPRYWRPEYSPKCILYISVLACTWWKDDCPLLRYCRPEYHLHFFLSLDIRLDMVKDNWSSPRYCRPE